MKRSLGMTLFFVTLTLVSCTKKAEDTASNSMTAHESTSASAPAPAPTELTIEDTTVGTGAVASAADSPLVTVHYTGTLLDGTKFDSSVGGNPFSFTLGVGQVIQGWDKGLEGMKVGGKRKLTIPAAMAYGASAVGTIPANSPLVFEVELLKVEKAK
jgi:FKBP-type peptidyl-prolyl cis-trans isomerase FkpA